MVLVRVGQHTWTSVPWTWKEIPYKWCDVPIFQEIADGGGGGPDTSGIGTDYLKGYKKLDKKKKERVIELICYAYGVDYKEKKTIKNIKVEAKDIKMLAEQILVKVKVI